MGFLSANFSSGPGPARDSNRIVGDYSDAPINHKYRYNEYAPDSPDRVARNGDDSYSDEMALRKQRSSQVDVDATKIRDKGHEQHGAHTSRTRRDEHRKSRIMDDDRPTSRIHNRKTSRIDVVVPTRQGFNAGQMPKESAQPQPNVIVRPSYNFRDPNSRGYNPYQ